MKIYYFTPGSRRKNKPVLDEPVVLTILGAIANNKNTVIELGGTALWLDVHSTTVLLERHVASVNGDGDGSDGGNSFLERILVPAGDIDESYIVTLGTTLAIVACSVLK